MSEKKETYFEKLLTETIEEIFLINEEKLEFDDSNSNYQSVFIVHLIDNGISTIRELNKDEKIKFFEKFRKDWKDKNAREKCLKRYEEYKKIAKDNSISSGKKIFLIYKNNKEAEKDYLEEQAFLDEIEFNF